MPWPKAVVTQVDAAPLLHRPQQAAGLAGQVDAGRHAEAEAVHELAEALDAEPLGDLGGADVARLGDDVGEGQHAVRVGVADGAIADRVVAVLAVDAILWPHHLLLERRAGEEGLEGRPRLVDVGDGAVAIDLRTDALDVVGIEARHVGHRQHFAGVGIERHQRAGARLELVHGALELLFGDPLQRDVDGELDVRAGARERPPPITHLELSPPRVVPDDQGLHPTPQLRIEGTLDAFQALAVDVREPEHVRGQRPVRVHPLPGRLTADPAQLEILHLVPLLDRHLPTQPDERRRRRGALQDDVARHVEQAGDGVDRVRLELARPQIDRRRIAAERQRLAEAVDDRAAGRRRLHAADDVADRRAA